MRGGARCGAPGAGFRAERIRRAIQIVSLGLFCWLLWRSALPLQTFVPVDSFLRLDPLGSLVVPLAARAWVPTLVPGLFVLITAVVAGRVFCGYICPMGTTFDGANRLMAFVFGSRQQAAKTGPVPLRRTQYLILACTLGAALFGFNLAFWVAPIPLITRLYALLLHPLLTLAGHVGLEAGQPLLAALDISALSYLQIPARRFAGLYFLLVFFGLLFWLEWLHPRFWCRFLCPAGALLGLVSMRPLWRRRVQACARCGQCARQCPVEAIAPDGITTASSECLACRACVDACPVSGVLFSVWPVQHETGARDRGTAHSGMALSFLPSRRAFLAAAGSGMGIAAVELSGVSGALNADGTTLVCTRPPGAIPEADFLARCVRCGQCMKVCPTNGLQPVWLETGFAGMFSPVLAARRGPCVPDCHACGQVCPTQAIRALPLAEKQWAKIGTAVVMPGRCLAWAEGKSCVVCQEVCPYGAVELAQSLGKGAPVPVVTAARCYGCGYCERHCPVRVPAIVVEPLGAMRRADTAYMRSGREAGLDLEPGRIKLDHSAPIQPEGRLPPGFEE